PYAVIAFPRILTSAIKILGDNRFLLSTDREAAPYTNIRHAIHLQVEACQAVSFAGGVRCGLSACTH
ncbi:hypothetical protein, partial [Ellagibacter isourolithinifaciens]|uniref:hypothetical protein n=1 Tax=Ellagibacter isourolithinifaciens TaxID=2137581 RepID=UPI001B87D036